MRPTVMVLFVAACAPVGGRPPAPLRGGAVVASAVADTGVVRQSGPVRVEPFVAAPHAIAIVEPREGESVGVDGANARRVVLDDGGYMDENPGSRVTLALDGEALRDVADVRAPLTLGGLAVDGRGVAPGDHTLIAVFVGARGEAERLGPDRRVISAVRHFSVGAPSGAPAETGAPKLVLLVPRGTYNGPIRAGSALLDFAIVGNDVVPSDVVVHLKIEGPGGVSEATIRGPGPYALKGLENGDYRFDLELENRGGPAGPWAHAARAITVNLDAPGR